MRNRARPTQIWDEWISYMGRSSFGTVGDTMWGLVLWKKRVAVELVEVYPKPPGNGGLINEPPRPSYISMTKHGIPLFTSELSRIKYPGFAACEFMI
jgi:hypothetical protein